MKNLNKLIALVLVVWVVTPIAIYLSFESWSERAQFGDFFGAVNALFSGLAFVGLIYTIWLQRDELEMQRQELKLQREEMIASRGELANQAAAQVALFHATAAQIHVAVAQAEIEAIKMECSPTFHHLNPEAIKKVRSLAVSLSSLSEKIEKGERATNNSFQG